MQVSFSLTGAEINIALLEKIKGLLQGNAQDFEILIRVKSKETQTLEEGRKRLEQRRLNLERGENVVQFTGEEFEVLSKQLSQR